MPFPIVMRAILGTHSRFLPLLLVLTLGVTGLPRVSEADPLNHLWSKSFGGISRDVNDEGCSVAGDGSGNMFVAGYFTGTTNFGGGELVANGQDGFLAKYDASGVHQWSRVFSGSGVLERATGVAVDGSGNVVVTGYFQGTANFGGADLTSTSGSTDIFVAKYNSAGVHLWSERFGGASIDRGQAVAVTPAGDMVVACTGSITLLRLDAAGATVWTKTIAGATPMDVGMLYGGAPLVTGYFNGTSNFGGSDLISAGGRDVFVASYSLDGVHQWSQRFGGAQDDMGLGIEAGFYCSLACIDLCAITGSFGGTVNFGAGDITSAGGTDGFVVTFYPQGFVTASWRFGGALEDYGFALSFRDNYITVTGSFEDEVDLGNGPLISAGGKDILVAKYDVSSVPQWSQRFGGPFDDEGRDIARSYPNYLVTGYFSGPVDFGGGALDNAAAFDIVTAAFNASGTHQWSHGFGGTGGVASDDQAKALTTDATGNVYMLAGMRGTADFGGGDFVHLGGTDVVLARYDADGTHQWSAYFGGMFNEIPEALAVDGSGNMIAAGRFSAITNLGGGDLVSQPVDQYSITDIFLAKYDASGAHLWSQRFGGTSFDSPVGVAVDGGGGIYLTGHFRNTVNFGGADLTSVGTSDIFLAKYNASGAHQWSMQFGGTSSETVTGIAVDIDGNSVITGSFNGTLTFGGATFLSAGGSDIFIARYDASGVHQWSRQVGSTGSDRANALALDASGNAMVIGAFQGTVDFGLGGLTSAGGDDIFIAKYGPSNVPQWAYRYGGASNDSGTELAANSTGDIAVAGWFGGTVDFGGGDLIAVTSGDLFVATYDAAGAHRTSQRFAANPGVAVSAGIVLGPGGRVTTTGFYTGAIDFGGGSMLSVGGQDIYLATLGPTPTPVSHAPVRVSLSAHPNPFNPQTQIHYTLPAKGPVRLSIYDARGARVATLVNREMPAGAHVASWVGRNAEESPVASGVYFAKLQAGAETRVVKLVLIK